MSDVVYLGEMELAWQVGGDEPESVKWSHRDASGASLRVTVQGGAVDSTQSAEADPLGQDAGLTDPYHVTAGQLKLWTRNYSGYGQSVNTQCTMDYMAADCGMVMQSMWAGAADQCRDNDCGPQRFRVVRKRDGKTVGQVQIVAVLPLAAEEGRRYLSELGVPALEVRQAQLGALSVGGTPTIIMVSRGTVTDVWVGKLDAAKESQVLSKL